MTKQYFKNNACGVPTTWLFICFLFLVGTTLGCGDDKQDASLEVPASSSVENEPEEEKALSDEEQSNLKQALEQAAEQQITAENAEAVAAELEKEIAADLK